MDPIINQINQLVRQIEELKEQLEISDEIIDTIFEETDELLSEEVLSEEEKKKKKWIQDAIKKPGALHKSLKVKSDKDIPVGKLEKASKKGGKLGKRARLALTLRKLNK
jgi:hypothetical protein